MVVAVFVAEFVEREGSAEKKDEEVSFLTHSS